MKTSILNIVVTTALVSLVFIGTSFASNSSYKNICTLNESSKVDKSYDDNRRKIRLGFTAPSTMHRQLLLTEDENATSGIDWGYDGEYYATEYDDMYWLIEGQFFTIQGTDIVDENSNFPLGFHTNEDGISTIGIDALENFSEEFELYLFDTELEVYHNLKGSDYEFYADAGVHLNRFELVFNNPAEPSDSLSVDENEIRNFKIYFNNVSNTLVLNNASNVTLKGLSIYNITGQLVYNYSLKGGPSRQEIQLNNQPAKGTYIVMVITEQGSVSKKVVLH